MCLVAPFTGAWIEITLTCTSAIADCESHPSRVRGLKYSSRAGAYYKMPGRTLHGCVD